MSKHGGMIVSYQSNDDGYCEVGFSNLKFKDRLLFMWLIISRRKGFTLCFYGGHPVEASE